MNGKPILAAQFAGHEHLETLNFILTNYLPRKTLTRFVGWLSRIEHPVLAATLIWIWQRFAEDLNFAEAKERKFRSLHACFVRELAPGARPVDARPEVVVSPCDAVVGAHGVIERDELLQVKGSTYPLSDLLQSSDIDQFRGGAYVTLRLKSSMYHRFHAPLDCTVSGVTFVPGEFWNVNPPTLKRVDRLFCRNERAVIPLDVAVGSVTLVPVAAILVASLKLDALESALDMNWRGPGVLSCHARYRKGEQMGYFQHGSTIIVLTSANYEIEAGIETGATIRMGQPLLRVRS